MLTLDAIQFPVYYLGTRQPEKEGSLVFLRFKVFGEEKVYIIDDTAIEGKDYKQRRLFLFSQGVPLLKINKAIFYFNDLLKFSNPQMFFIDSNGKIFNYRKSKTYKVYFHKIKQIIPDGVGGGVVECFNVQQRFRLLHLPPETKNWAALFHIGTSFLLYGLYDEYQEPLTRRI
jgi:hypothetical protein